jgi:putative heme iron utilization protein
MTLIGTAAQVLSGPERSYLRSRFLRRHPKAALYVDFPDFSFWRFATSRASLNAGFGKAYALSASDLATPGDAVPALSEMEDGAVEHMNKDHVAAVERYAQSLGEKPEGWRISNLDPEGLDLMVGDRVARLWFDRPLSSAAELRPVLVSLAKEPDGK